MILGPMSPRFWVCCAGLLTALTTGPLAAQGLSWTTVATFYADNTEFFTPYRVGATILGAQFHSSLEMRPGRRTSFRLGVFGDQRSGSDEFLERPRPIVAFQYQTRRSTGVLGTVLPVRRHGFLDALQVSTLELTRPLEYGGQWTERRRHWDGEVFLNWQKLNRVDQREAFDFGWVLRVRPHRLVTLESQLHGIHNGGQLFSAGVPVTNNTASALGLTVADSFRWVGKSSLAFYRLRSSGNIDPAAPAGRPEKGRGWLLRASVAPRGWFELFSISWWGRDFLAQEGDNHYNSVGADPSYYRSQRRYWELGLIRRAEIEGGVTFDGEIRLHRIDNRKSIAIGTSKWEYSYRLVVRAPFDLMLIDRGALRRER